MPEHHWYKVNYGQANADRWEAYDAWGNCWSAPSDRSAITIHCVSGIVGYGLSEQEAWAHVVSQEARRGRILPHFEVPELQDPLQHHEYEDTWLDV